MPNPSVGTVGPGEFRRIREIFESALDRQSAERAAFVEQACDGNLALAKEVQQMLAADAQHNTLLDSTTARSTDRLRVGETLGTSFRIVATLGRGGMGEVYRATDTKLGRDVALKILPAVFAVDADRLARFKREAQVLASLNHPNIATIYGFEECGTSAVAAHSPIQALVLELIDGPTLADRIVKGRIPIDEALPIARQIAAALEAAHEQGIIHRDLKPANIKLKSDDAVKVLDFGLAKMLQPRTIPGSESPEITSLSMVDRGVVMGTATYMSPEQAKGHEATQRSDVWSFGAVLYEMLAGQRAFNGENVSDTLASVLRSDVDWSALDPSTPVALRQLLARCLDRDVKRRLRDIGEARIVLDDLIAPATAPKQSAAGMPQAPFWRRAIAMGFSIILIGALAAAATWYFKPSTAREVTRLSFALPEALFANRSGLAISPDGTQVVYATQKGLELRSMSSLQSQVIRGTENFFGVAEPAFSPDGRFLVFHAASDHSLKIIPVTGGVATTIARIGAGTTSVRWDAHGILFVAPESALDPGENQSVAVGGYLVLGHIMRVSPEGGAPEILVRFEEGDTGHGAQILPDGRHVLFTVASGTAPDRWDKARIAVQSLVSGERKTVLEGGSDARYVPTGHLVYAVGGRLFAVAFDVERLEVSGSAVPMIEGVTRADPLSSGGAQFAFAKNGTLIYLPGPASAQSDIALTDRKGGVELLQLPPATYEVPRVSPNGKLIAFGVDDGKEATVYVYDLSGTTAMRRLTFEGRNRFPTWTSDGRRVAFQSDRDGDSAIFWQPVEGGKAERLTTPEQGESHEPEAWSPKGDTLLFSVTKGSDIALWALSLKDRKAQPYGDVHSSTRTNAVFSPDAQWVAYGSTVGNSTTIYLQPFPATGAKYELPAERERPSHPVWSPDGKELFFNPAPRQFRSVSVTTQPTFAFGNPVPLKRPSPAAHPLRRRAYDITPDGRFVASIPAEQSEAGASATPQVQVVLNWFEELRARVPVAR